MDYDREFGTTGTPMRRGYDYGRGRDRYTLGGEYGSSSRVGTGVGYSGARSDLGENRDYESEREGYYGRTHSGGYGYGGRGRGVDREYNRGYDREYGREYDRGYGEREDRGWLERAADQVRSWFGDEESERRRSMDKASEGEYRGRGPRGYRRSDERIREEINDRLTDHPYLDASDIEVTVNSGEVTLSGMVDNRNAKHLAEDIAEDISGVTNVENRLRVRQTRWGAASSTEERTTTAETLRTTADREAAATTTSTGSSGRRTG
jgi:osmotically-inducible protein OsmY